MQTSPELTARLPAPAREVVAYSPHTKPGAYARTAGAFLPNALTLGGVPLKVAAVAVPTLASETAGQLTHGTAWETPARVAGAAFGFGGMRAVAAPTRGRAFWSGGDPAKNAAAEWAAQTGGVT